MPEPTTELVKQVREWLAAQQDARPEDVTLGGWTSRLSYILGAYDIVEARAAAAEAAVQRVRDFTKPGHDQCIHRPHAIDGEYERGRAHALDDVWRLLDTDPGSAGQPVGLAGEGGAAATAPALPADPTSRVMPPEIPLPSVAALDDGRSATVTATISNVHHRRNTAGTEYGWIVLVDDSSDTAWPVRVSPAGWRKYQHHLTVGAKVTALVAASRDETGLTLWLTSAATLDWTTVEAADLTAADGTP
jgi:hypothetical protein